MPAAVSGSGDDAAELTAEDCCPVCLKPFNPDDECATDIELGTCHAACLEGSPTVDLQSGLTVDGPIPTYRYDEIPAHIPAPIEVQPVAKLLMPVYSPRVRAMVAAEHAAMAIGTNGLAIGSSSFDPAIYDVLDTSPDIPASALLRFISSELFAPSEPVAEALKATYCGLQPWVKAQAAKAEAEREAERLKRPSRYEKSGKEEPAGAKVVDAAEQARIQRNRTDVPVMGGAAWDVAGDEAVDQGDEP